MNLYERAVTAICYLANFMLWERPTEKPFRFFRPHVNTTMAHGDAKVLVPVGSMKGMSLCREETGPGHAGELVIVCIGKEIPVAHVLGRILFKDAEVTLRRFCREPIRAAWTVGYSR